MKYNLNGYDFIFALLGVFAAALLIKFHFYFSSTQNLVIIFASAIVGLITLELVRAMLKAVGLKLPFDKRIPLV